MLTVPSYEDLMSGRSALTTIRTIELDDLLGRDPVVLDNAGLGEWLGNRVVMVTGAGGSIGAELCRHIARYRPAKVVLFDLSEAAVYSIQTALADAFPQLPWRRSSGTSSTRRSSTKYSRASGPASSFTRAPTSVPLMEETNAWQAVRNNAYGTWVLAMAAVAARVEKFVLVSSDKAVNPTNVMGATKRLAEIVCRSLQGRGTQFVLVRFGNVFGSAGSVIPRFREQIARGGPVTVTHPDITRYFMSLSEATSSSCRQRCRARAARSGARHGRAVRIIDLAHDMIRLSGADPDRIAIVFTGLRPGESCTRSCSPPKRRLADAAPEAADCARPCGESRRGRADGRVVRTRSRRRRRRGPRAPQVVDPGVHAAGARLSTDPGGNRRYRIGTAALRAPRRR